LENIQKHLDLLGHRVQDRVTGYEGVATSVCFDLYGCIQVVINPGLTPDGKLGEQCWFDVNRILVLEQELVMERPDFVKGPIAEGGKGPESKPQPNAC